ncbi:MAG: 2-oxo acid dehydrogenase subunit E2 [Deltaproteobacteria bacterium]|nr:2-oxo acid dehydrogenase subunit E2 [Deltaproteobacteria bacterium]
MNFEAAYALRERLLAERGFKLSPVVLLVKAVARALALEPQAHAFLQGGTLIRPGQVDVGVSVAGRGNFAPVAVLTAVESKSVFDLTAELRDLAAKKREEEDRALKLFGILYWVLGFDPVRRAALAFRLRRFPDRAPARRHHPGEHAAAVRSLLAVALQLVGGGGAGCDQAAGVGGERCGAGGAGGADHHRHRSPRARWLEGRPLPRRGRPRALRPGGARELRVRRATGTPP